MINPLTNKRYTLKQAKIDCKEKLGRLVKPGREIALITGEAYHKVISALPYTFGNDLSGIYPFKIYLQNNAGSFRLWIHWSVNPVSYGVSHE